MKYFLPVECRPISNIRFLAKATEKVIACKLDCHLTNSNNHEVLVRVHNDFLRGIDEGGCVVLLLLDFFAAFNTVDHDILLTCLCTVFGIKGKGLACFRLYPSDRTQFVQIDDDSSHHHNLSCGVPQGSIRGPIPFSLFLSPLADVIRRHKTRCHFYANDGQLCMTLKNH